MENILLWRAHHSINRKYTSLLAGTCACDEASQEQIKQMMIDYGTAVKRMCLIYLKDPGLAEEAAQDTFVKAYFRIGTLHDIHAQKAWLSAIAVNTCKDYLRKNWIKRRGRDVSLDQLSIEPSASTEDRQLVEAISSLDKEHKAVILMRYYQGLRVSEIAEQLHCSQSSIYRRLQKAERLLRDYMEE